MIFGGVKFKCDNARAFLNTADVSISPLANVLSEAVPSNTLETEGEKSSAAS